jgi:hypothetical protein
MSLRYARVVLVLVLVALVPTVVNSYFGATVDEGPVLAETIPETIDGFRGTPTDRRDASVRRSFDATDWVERTYVRGDEEVSLFVARSFDMKKLYHHPELAVAYGLELKPGRVETFDAPGGPIHVHVLEGEQAGLVAYALLYRDETVARPLLFQVLVAPDLLLRGRRPLTLAFVTAPGHSPGTSVKDSPAVTMLRAVVEHLRNATATAN